MPIDQYYKQGRVAPDMASGGIIPSAGGKPQTDAMLVDKLPEEINEMKIRDDKVEKVGSGKRTTYSGPFI